MFIDMESSRQGKVFVAVIGRYGGRVKVLQKLVVFLGEGSQALPLGFTIYLRLVSMQVLRPHFWTLGLRDGTFFSDSRK